MQERKTNQKIRTKNKWVKADIRNPLRYLLITFIVSKLALLMIQASPHPLLIAPRNHAGDLLDSVKKPAGHLRWR